MRFLVAQDLHPGPLADKVEKVGAAIERDDFRSPDVKKLHVADYYRAKLDASARLLLRFATFRGEKACLALEVLPQHDYSRSRYLRGAPVDDASLVEPIEPHGLETAPLRYLHPQRSHFTVLDKPLSFDDTQEQALHRPLPLVLVGSAGSGKTALIVERLRRHPGRVAYVTESAWLAELARSLYVSHGFDPGEREADFLSYRQLLESVAVPEGRPVTFREFARWFDRHRAKVPFAGAHQCFEELRGVVTAEPFGPLSLDAYVALGVRQSIFTQEQRVALHALFTSYRAWLETERLYEGNLVAQAWLSKMTPRYDFVAIDEVQDLTNAQLALVLRALQPGGDFLLAGDANQIVHPNFFSWAKVKSLFWRGEVLEGGRDVVLLSTSYRNSHAVTAAANALLKVKHARFGSIDRESTGLMQTSDCPEGSVSGFKTGSPEVRELDEKTRRSTRAAVVVLRDEDKAGARQHFRTPLVFTVLEAKGLEYETVILYRLVSAERRVFAELCEGVTGADLEVEALDYRRAKDKGDRSLEAYKFFVNALYVALTRAVGHVHLVEDDPEHPLLKLLGVPFGAGTTEVQQVTATAEDWQREARRLEQHGKLEQAEAIRAEVLRLTPVPWTVLDHKALRALAEKALPPDSPSAKARQQLTEYAIVNGEDLLRERLAALKVPLAAAPVEQRRAAIGRYADAYLPGKKLKPVLEETEKYGVDFRSPHNLTPLMLAATQANRALVEALLERGADPEARDNLGRAALNHLLLRAYGDPSLAKGGDLGALYDVLAPPSFDLEVDGHLVQVGREQGEYFYFQAFISVVPRLFNSRWGRFEGVTAELLQALPLRHFPDVVVQEHRRRREYLNHLLARNEPGSAYTPNRKLWVRERRGHYWPNPAVKWKVGAASGDERWVPLPELLHLAWHESHLEPPPAMRAR